MTNREKALEMADAAMGREHEGGGPSSMELMVYALVLVLADIGEQLEHIDGNLDLIVAHGIGVEN